MQDNPTPQTVKPTQRPWYYQPWFWFTSGAVVLALAIGTTLLVLFMTKRPATPLSEADKTMLQKYYPDFKLSENFDIRDCQLKTLRSGINAVEAYKDNAAAPRAHYERLAEECDPSNKDKLNTMKPILYLYPTQETTLHVTMQHPERIEVDYPAYGSDGWTVVAQPNGDLTDNRSKKYYALYWDERGSSDISFTTGFYVEKDNAAAFLEEKLSQIGLSDRERNEFIMYWLPKLEKNAKSLVYFELTDELQNQNALKISPQPDRLLRVHIHIKKVNTRVDLPAQPLPHFERKGFTAVEWGGTEH